MKVTIDCPKCSYNTISVDIRPNPFSPDENAYMHLPCTKCGHMPDASYVIDIVIRKEKDV